MTYIHNNFSIEKNCIYGKNEIINTSSFDLKKILNEIILNINININNNIIKSNSIYYLFYNIFDFKNTIENIKFNSTQKYLIKKNFDYNDIDFKILKKLIIKDFFIIIKDKYDLGIINFDKSLYEGIDSFINTKYKGKIYYYCIFPYIIYLNYLRVNNLKPNKKYIPYIKNIIKKYSKTIYIQDHYFLNLRNMIDYKSKSKKNFNKIKNSNNLFIYYTEKDIEKISLNNVDLIKIFKKIIVKDNEAFISDNKIVNYNVYYVLKTSKFLNKNNLITIFDLNYLKISNLKIKELFFEEDEIIYKIEDKIKFNKRYMLNVSYIYIPLYYIEKYELIYNYLYETIFNDLNKNENEIIFKDKNFLI